MLHDLQPTIPLEVLTNVAYHLQYEEAAQFSDYKPIATLLTSRDYWRRKTLRIISRSKLRSILDDPHTKSAVKLNLAKADIDDVDLSFVVQHFKQIEEIDLAFNPDLTDESIIGLIETHGPWMKRLTLTKLFRLTNQSMERLGLHCPSLERLELEGTMISAAGLQMASLRKERLRSLSISRCHLIDTARLPAILSELPSLMSLKMTHLDLLELYQVQALLQSCTHLQRIDVTGCPEFTLKSIRQLIGLREHLEIIHDARLEDHTVDAVRRFLLGMVSTV